MNEADARAALRAQGITNPSKGLVENWLKVHEASPHSVQEAQEPQQQPALDKPPEQEPRERPSSRSTLEPHLRESGQLERPAGPRKAGRPRILAPFFQCLATAMSDGTPLREALSRCGVHGLSPREIRALYRNRALRTMREEARQKWLREWGIRPKRPTARPKGCRGGDCLGAKLRALYRNL